MLAVKIVAGIFSFGMQSFGEKFDLIIFFFFHFMLSLSRYAVSACKCVHVCSIRSLLDGTEVCENFPFLLIVWSLSRILSRFVTVFVFAVVEYTCVCVCASEF